MNSSPDMGLLDMGAHADAIYPVILCGGSGTRLWPVSSPAQPKPFLPLIGDATLFEQAIARVSGSGAGGAGDAADFAQPIVVAGGQHCDAITAQMHGAGHTIIVEPAARNTAPAIALAAAMLPDEAVMLVCPSDHHIANTAAFREAAHAAAQLARQGRLVSFGITPEHPETGYGYLRRGGELPGGYEIAQFVEKPDLERAKSYLESGEYSWNGGIFAFQAGTLMKEVAQHRPDMARRVTAAIAGAERNGVQVHPDSAQFEAIKGESIDYAIMENTESAAMVPADMGWSDIGNWAAMQDALSKNEDGASERASGAANDGTRGASTDAITDIRTDENANTARGPADFDGCRNVLAYSDGARVSAVGLEDVCIVVSGGEVLVTTRDGAQRVGKLPGASGVKPPAGSRSN